ncbi:MAG: acetyl-CoA carboxylase carboxyltransferase subunit beta [Elusimicrobia bacterium]|nr:acetyl-CoA carboxylase carboxyltransferase subunit beta [Elusimicrobiota bacterium]
MAESTKNEGLWIECPRCAQIIYKKELNENFKICPKCNSYLRMNAKERLCLLLDKKEDGTPIFEEFAANLASQDPLDFGELNDAKEHAKESPKIKSSYLLKLAAEQKKTNSLEAVICGEGKIGTHKISIALLNFEFMGGSMGSVVGEKVTKAIEVSLEKKIPLLLVSSSGGARMQEGVLSLMQMAKTSCALSRLDENKILVLSLLTDPTTGGVTASFSMLGDLLISEPKALIAFAGPRVIEQTIRQKLPDGFQQSEFLLKHGMMDCIFERKDLRSKLITFLNFFNSTKQFSSLNIS